MESDIAHIHRKVPYYEIQQMSKSIELQGISNVVESDVEMIIRKETDADIEAITEVTNASFKTLPVSNQTEQFIAKWLTMG